MVDRIQDNALLRRSPWYRRPAFQRLPRPPRLPSFPRSPSLRRSLAPRHLPSPSDQLFFAAPGSPLSASFVGELDNDMAERRNGLEKDQADVDTALLPPGDFSSQESTPLSEGKLDHHVD